jgi:MYXO-CTERM domain-containing protein
MLMSNALRLLLLAVAFSITPAAFAQGTATDGTYETQDTEDDDFDYGWLGLLGLAGLAGLRKRPEHHEVRRADTPGIR